METQSNGSCNDGQKEDMIKCLQNELVKVTKITLVHTSNLSIYIIVGVRVCVSCYASHKGKSKLCDLQHRERGAFGATNA